MTHAHITTWAIALILFLVVLALHKSGKAKGAKIVSMTLRLFYILIVATGILLLLEININGAYLWKALVGIVVIGLMEMITVRTRKAKSTTVFWVLFVLALVYVIYLGFSMSMGFKFF
ncbi:YisL family protein [Sutcliffiella deserti]|uniref:YisL family protein n=1 Tax=Sutcliffiella deserti TaxID=2875501 RepID=UPI001CBAB854|nr:YisL family protein [Sutcliffiella deserti]